MTTFFALTSVVSAGEVDSSSDLGSPVSATVFPPFDRIVRIIILVIIAPQLQCSKINPANTLVRTASDHRCPYCEITNIPGDSGPCQMDQARG